MNKVAGYLSEHILGEVTTSKSLTHLASRDKSALELAPELVIYPRVTNDIRKITRFAWQLAEKGHRLPMTIRGHGNSETGSAIGRGALISLPCHMYQIFEYDAKQRLVRLQPGATVGALMSALRLHGTTIPALQDVSPDATIGGMVATNHRGAYAAKYGDMTGAVDQLEVVLASGDVLQTGRISKRDLNRKKGLQTFEGEIYRGVDNLIEDNQELLAKMVEEEPENLGGYAGLAHVKQRDGSFDLTPLFIGSEGTLGFISEMILRSEFSSFQSDVALLAFTEKTAARDATEQIRKLEPSFAEYIDAELFVEATKLGKSYSWLDKDNTSGAVLVVGFDDFSDRARAKKVKKLRKMFDQVTSEIIIGSTHDRSEDVQPLLAAMDVSSAVYRSGDGETWPALFDGFYVPENRFEDFAGALAQLAAKHRQTLALHGHILTSVYTCRPKLHLGRVGDKQKVFKLLDEVANLVAHHGGYLIGGGGEGRLRAKFVIKHMSDEQKALTLAVKQIFDPHGLLSPGVKEDVDIRTLVGMLARDRVA